MSDKTAMLRMIGATEWPILLEQGLLQKDALLLDVLKRELPTELGVELGQEVDTGRLTYLIGMSPAANVGAATPPFVSAIRVHLSIRAVRTIRTNRPMLLPVISDVLNVDRLVILAQLSDSDIEDTVGWLGCCGFRAPRQAHSMMIESLGFDYGMAFRFVRS